MTGLAIDWIRERLKTGQYFFSQHGDEERASDDLSVAEVLQAIMGGRVIESCLVAGYGDTGIPVHVV